MEHCATFRTNRHRLLADVAWQPCRVDRGSLDLVTIALIRLQKIGFGNDFVVRPSHQGRHHLNGNALA